DSADGSAVYGAGGGVTWASTAEAEYEELLIKAAVLPTGTREPFALLETFAVEGGVARNLAAHLERLLDSAAHVGIPAEREQLEAAVHAAVAGAGPDAVLLRLALWRDGSLEVTSRPLTAAPGPVRLALDTERTVFPVGLSRPKTTVRGHFAAARERHPGADGGVLRGDRAHLAPPAAGRRMPGRRGPAPRPRPARGGGAPADDRGGARRGGARRDQRRPGLAAGGAGRGGRAAVRRADDTATVYAGTG